MQFGPEKRSVRALYRRAPHRGPDGTILPSVPMTMPCRLAHLAAAPAAGKFFEGFVDVRMTGVALPLSPRASSASARLQNGLISAASLLGILIGAIGARRHVRTRSGARECSSSR